MGNLDIMALKTPEERKAIAAKAQATLRLNKEKKSAMMSSSIEYMDSLQVKITTLEDKLAQLKRIDVLSCIFAKSSGNSFLQEDQIVKLSLPWDNLVGIYFLIKDERVVYVGQSISIASRISNHTNKDFDRHAFILCEKHDLNAMESFYIHVLRPKLNAQFPNGNMIAPISFADLISNNAT